MDAFHARSDITHQLKTKLQCDALVVVGTKASHVHAAEYMHSHMDKVNTSLNHPVKNLPEIHLKN